MVERASHPTCGGRSTQEKSRMSHTRSDAASFDIDDGTHDLVLSAKPVRAEVYRQPFARLDRVGA